MGRLLWNASVFAYAFALASVLVGMLARVVPPLSIWWFQPVAILLPFSLFLLFLMTLAIVLRRRWLLAGAGIVMLLFAMLRGGIGSSSTGAESEDDLKVATLNSGGQVRSGRAYDRGIPQLIAKHSPDVLCLQELWTARTGSEPRTHEAVHLAMDTLDYRFVAATDRPPGVDVPTFITRLRVDSISAAVFKRSPNDLSATSYIRAVLSFESRSIVIYNVSLRGYGAVLPLTAGSGMRLRDWFTFIRGARDAYAQRASDAASIRDAVAKEQLPTVLCGDFNSTPGEWVYGAMSTGMIDAFHTKGRFWGPTFPSTSPFVRIDYVMATPDWLVTGAEVGGRMPPDHRPVIATMRLKSEPTPDR